MTIPAAARLEALTRGAPAPIPSAETSRPLMATLPADPAPEIIVVSTKRIKCDGGGGALGHPLVYYDMGEADFVDCLYCDRHFVYEPGESGGDHHHHH
jgi:uncharacterized Zn-finger protein